MTLLYAIFGGGLWIIPVGIFIAMCWSAYRGYRSSKSNSTRQTPNGIIDNTGNVPYYKTGGGIFSIILFVALIAVIILMVSDK